MKAFIHQDKGYRYVTDFPNQDIGPFDVRVALQAAGVNRRDLYIQDRRAGENTPLVLGSDGAGIIVEVGEKVTKWTVGDRVLINPALRWFEESPIPPEDFDILGMPDHGTFAEEIVINEEQVEAILPHLSWEENAVIALAGMTGYRALITKGQLQEGETVFIPGGSSGVATFMIQLAKSKGARVITTTRFEEKVEEIRSFGADIVLDTVSDWEAQLQEEIIDLVVDSVGSATFHRSLSVLRKGGRFVTFGSSTMDDVTINIRTFFYNQQTIYGSTMGSREELRALLRWMKEEKIHPILDKVYRLNEAAKGLERIQESDQVGKVALKIR